VIKNLQLPWKATPRARKIHGQDILKNNSIPKGLKLSQNTMKNKAEDNRNTIREESKETTTKESIKVNMIILKESIEKKEGE